MSGMSCDEICITLQCPKLRFKCVHPPGAEGGKCVHQELK